MPAAATFTTERTSANSRARAKRGGCAPAELTKHVKAECALSQRFGGSETVHPDLAGLLATWKSRQRAADQASAAAEAGTSGEQVKRDHQKKAAEASLNAVQMAIVHHRAQSMHDVMAKFETIRRIAEIEDIPLMLEESQTTMEKMMWSICADLADLRVLDVKPIVQATSTECHVAGIADQFRKTADLHDAKDEKHSATGAYPRDGIVDALCDRIEFLKKAASQEQAISIKGALFQIAVVGSLVDQAIHSPGWREVFGVDPDVAFNPPKETMRLETDIYRLLCSAVAAIAMFHGIAPREFAGDYFLTFNPFEDMGC